MTAIGGHVRLEPNETRQVVWNSEAAGQVRGGFTEWGALEMCLEGWGDPEDRAFQRGEGRGFQALSGGQEGSSLLAPRVCQGGEAGRDRNSLR